MKTVLFIIEPFQVEPLGLAYLAAAMKKAGHRAIMIKYNDPELEDKIRKLKSAYNKIEQRDNVEFYEELKSAKNDFLRRIFNWRKKKIKMTSDEEAIRISKEFITEIDVFFKAFIDQMYTLFHAKVDDINSEYNTIYDLAKFDDSFNGSESIVATMVYFSMLETMKRIKDKDDDE